MQLFDRYIKKTDDQKQKSSLKSSRKSRLKSSQLKDKPKVKTKVKVLAIRDLTHCLKKVFCTDKMTMCNRNNSTESIHLNLLLINCKVVYNT